jgi:hypothetical protein
MKTLSDALHYRGFADGERGRFEGPALPGPWGVPFVTDIELRGLELLFANNVERRPELKLTLDSSEPLEDAMRVVGALYGVTLTVSGDDQRASKPAQKATRRPSAAKKARVAAPAADANAGAAQRKTASRSAGLPRNAEVRSWAREHGMTVSDRGRVPASVMTAYRQAHNE